MNAKPRDSRVRTNTTMPMINLPGVLELISQQQLVQHSTVGMQIAKKMPIGTSKIKNGMFAV